MKKRVKRLMSVFLSLILALSLAPVTVAEPEGSFCLFVATTSQTVIAPTRIAYTSGQTIMDALDASGYSFVRAGYFLQLVEGVEGGYLICYDGGGYDLTQPASSVTAVTITENESAAEEHLALLRYLVQFGERTDNAQNYAPAKAAYDAAIVTLRTGNAAAAQEKLQALQNAAAEYEALFEGEKYDLTVAVTQNGAQLASPAVTLTDAYGNVTSFTGTTAQVIAGTYTVSVSDGGWNRAERTVTVTGKTPLSFELPYGEWYGQINLLDQATRRAYDKTQDETCHTLTVSVPDTAGLTNPIVNAAQGPDIPSASETRLYGVYTGINGVYYGDTAKSWNSNASSLMSLFSQGMGERVFALEARYSPDGETTQIQSYFVSVERFPTLKSLRVVEENTVLPLSFDPLKNEYALTVSADGVTVLAEGFGAYTVSGDGSVAVPDDLTHTVTVTSGERTNSYTLTLQKEDAVTVRLSVPDGTTAELFNAADSLIEPVNGEYHLIPGEEYYYISTKDAVYHATQSFTASDGLTVSVAEPQTQDRLTDFALYNGSSASTRRAYTLDSPFTASAHELGCTIPDAVSLVYAQATAADGYTVRALYDRQTANASTNGTPYSVTVNKTVGASGVNPLTGCVTSGGYSQRVTVRVEKKDGEVTQYQEYALLLRRQEHLKSLTLSAESEALPLLDGGGSAVDFNRDVTQYAVSVDRATSELTLDGAFINESDATSACGGYYALVGGERYDALTQIALPLDRQQSEETVTVRVCHADPEAVPTTYTVTVRKTDPVSVAFSTEPADATVFVTSNSTGKRVPETDGCFLLIPGQSYTYTVTAPGYVGRRVADYTAPAEAATVAVTLTAAEANGELPDYDAYWGSSRYDEYNNGVVSARTPASAEDAVLYWAAKVGEGYSSDACGCPIIVNGFLYTYAGSTLYKIDTISGEILAEGKMDHSSSFAINAPTYAEGMIFVGLSNGTVQAFNAETLASVWIYHDELKGQPNCPIVYRDGCLYTGFWNGETSSANYVCLSVTDEDTAQEKEEKLPTWTYTCKGGFYWAGAYVADNYLLVCTDDGAIGYTTGYARLLSLDSKTGMLLDVVTMPFPGDLRSGVTFVPDGSGGGRGYFTSKGGYFYRIDVRADGTFVPGSLKGLRLSNGASDASNPPMSTSTPTVYNGRAYVGVSGAAQFGQYSGHNITVIDLNGWSVAYTVPTQGYPQSSGLLTTAYEEQTGSVNIYFFDNYTPGKLRMITDKPGQTAPQPVTVETYTSGGASREYETGYVLFTPYAEQAQYCICSPIVDEYGTVYFKNDSAYMMAVGSAITSLEITQQPEKTAYAVGETFDGTGMVVTATYSNGATRDVTDYVEWSQQALTANDTQFQIYFPYTMYHDENGQAGVRVEEPFAVLTLTVEQGTPLRGDLNGDGKVNNKDALLLFRYVSGIIPEGTFPLERVDLNNDGKVNNRDALLLFRYVSGVISSLD